MLRADYPPMLVTTMTDARRLALRVGQAVSVTGGLDPEGNFASGSILVESPEGVERRVEDAPADRRKAPGLVRAAVVLAAFVAIGWILSLLTR